MRITNKVMQNNALTNINRNKELQDNLTTQLSTGKKIYKPSEDPVTAIRALRLRSDVSQTTQFYKKNVPDAQSWLELTESSIKTTVSVVTNMIGECEKGANDPLKTEDRQTIINSLKQLREEVYSTGDADYAGRYIFTGYRTDTSLSFSENTSQTYSITEIFNANDIVKGSYVDTGDLTKVSESNYDNAGAGLVTENDITNNSFYRIRLSYDNLDSSNPPASIMVNGTDTAITVQTDKATAYKDAAAGGGPFFIPSTGEIVMSEDTFNEAKKDLTSDISVTYDKTNWLDGDLRPQHYFYCTTEDEDGNTIEYNPEYLTNKKVDQEIEYQVGFSQSIRVNTCAGEIYQHALGRDVDEILNLANELDKVEKAQAKLKSMSKDTVTYSEDQIASIKEDLDAADKAITFMKDQLQKTFSKCITSMQSYLDSTNEAISLVGNRSSRLSLIDNRLANQTTTFKTLQSENEDADATEVAVQLSSAQVSYQAALMATSDMVKETLLNYL